MVRASTGSPRIGWPRAVARCTAQLLVTGALTAVSLLLRNLTDSETTQVLVEFGVTAAIATWIMTDVGAYYGTRDRQFLHDLIGDTVRSEEHTSELQSLMRISYAVFCLKKKKREH